MSYSTDNDLDLEFGAANITRWADLDNDGNSTKIAARKAWAHARAQTEIDSLLRESRYRLPLADANGDTPDLIAQVAAMIAGVMLYEGRGTRSIDGQQGRPVHPYTAKSFEARRILDEIRTGTRKLDAIGG
ncbi:MAG: phage protein Gp36 family protein [Planctomycetota bacterium]